MRGFTLVELVIVLVLVSVLAVVALGRLGSVEGYRAYAFYESTRAAVRHAQRQATARNELIEVAVSGNGVQITRDANPGSPGFQAGAALVNPGTGQPWDGSTEARGLAPDGVSLVLSGGAVVFDGLGRASAGRSLTVTGEDGSSYTITVEPSGYVH